MFHLTEMDQNPENEPCDTDIILIDECLTKEEKCEYFLLSDLPLFDIEVYINLMLFFWEGIAFSIDAAAAFLKIIHQLPVSTVVSLLTLDAILEIISQDLNPVFAKIFIYLQPICKTVIYDVNSLIEAAKEDPLGFIYLKVLTKYIEFYIEQMLPEHFDMLLQIENPNQLYREAVIELYYAGASFHEELLSTAMNLERQEYS